jgi:nicotinamide-nucleotide amidase
MASLKKKSDVASRVVRFCVKGKVRFGCVESCTGGAVAAKIVGIPGASDAFFGSMVAYQLEAKRSWLGVETETGVDADVTEALAEGLIRKNPELDWTIAVTGHLGPKAPKGLDGTVFIAIASRFDSATVVYRHLLKKKKRVDRQWEASELALVEFWSALRA